AGAPGGSRPGLHPLPWGRPPPVGLAPAGLKGANRRLGDFVPVAEVQVTGLGARFRNAGIGAPLAADMQANDPNAADYLSPTAKAPVTALLRIDQARAQLTRPVVDGSLEIFDASETRSVDIDGKPVP